MTLQAVRKLSTWSLAVVLGLGAAAGWAAVGAPVAHADADGCDAGISTDFNGDGRSDAVVADPNATAAGQAGAGRVVVLYGDSDSAVGEGARGVVYQGLGSVGGTPEAGDHFGAAVATADLDCDGYTDLVVGVPDEDISAQSASGYVQVVWGSAGGLTAGDPSLQYTQSSFGRPITAGDRFGYAVDALEDVGQEGTGAPDAYAIAIGIPGANVNGHNDAGAVAFDNAFDGGTFKSVQTQDTPGVPGQAETGDRFGAAVSLNYLIGASSVVDAAVGVPNEDVGSRQDAGAVTVIEDVDDDEFAGGEGIDQNSGNVPGVAEAGDRFGAVLDTVRVAGATELAVGAPGEDVGTAGNAGAVQLFGSAGSTLLPGLGLNQDTAGVSGQAEAGDGFGSALALLRPGLGDTKTRLAVGAPGENGAAHDSGLVQVFPVSDLDAETTWSQDSPGVPGVAQSGDRFGARVAAVAGAGERVILVGVPDDVTNSHGMVDVIPVSVGPLRAWIPGVGGISNVGPSRFGDALASSGT